MTGCSRCYYNDKCTIEIKDNNQYVSEEGQRTKVCDKCACNDNFKCNRGGFYPCDNFESIE